jgi:hypothetical protein
MGIVYDGKGKWWFEHRTKSVVFACEGLYVHDDPANKQGIFEMDYEDFDDFVKTVKMSIKSRRDKKK